MSNYTGDVNNSVVKIKIVSASPQSWYAKKIGHVVEAYKSEYPDGYISYKQFPRPKGLEPSGDYTNRDVEEQS